MKQNEGSNRRKEIIDVCLKEFIENGLCRTSARDLAQALNMQTSGLYYYFKNKDDIVVACAEEAGIYMEDVLILPFLECLDEPDRYQSIAEQHMEESSAMMRFFAQVCTSGEYRGAIQPVLERMKKRHQEYAIKFAESLECKVEEVAPYLYTSVAIFANYMIFGEEFYYVEPFKFLTESVQAFKERKRNERLR